VNQLFIREIVGDGLQTPQVFLCQTVQPGGAVILEYAKTLNLTTEQLND
jgi:hypothetical protein